MPHVATTDRPRRTRLLIAFGMLAAALVAVIGLQSGPAFAAAPAACVANADTGCIGGTLQNSAGPVEGVTITVTDDDGFEEETTTAANGTWSVAIPERARYTVELDESTLPTTAALADTAENPVEKLAVAGASSTVDFNLVLDATPNAGGSTSATGTVTPTRLLQQFALGIRYGLILALAAVGLSLIYGTTGLSSFSHGEQVTLGALLTFVFSIQLHWPIVLSVLAAVILSALSGWLQDIVLWRPLRRRRVGLVQLMIVTIGLSLALQYLFQFQFGGSTLQVLPSIAKAWSVGPIRLSIPSYIAMGCATVVLVGVALFLQRTRTGRATRAISDNPALAAASGIDVDKIIRLVWILATGLAGLGGALLALAFNGASWDLGLQMLLLMFAAVTLGGLGTAYGALIGSLIIGVVVEMSTLWLPSSLKFAVALLILILVLLVRPQGILGRAERIG
ncbi:branched-chain amino acid ABC transporter permease [Cellulomonas fengjieae]|nr:branched-chain amino acid ABC transporter permease [Cellulomonas fengjieae]